MKKTITFFLCIFVINLLAQNNFEQYSTVGITYEDYQILVEDPSHGLAIDHFHKNESALLEFVFSQSELRQLTDRGISYEVIIENYISHFQNLVNETSRLRTASCGLDNFDDGNMGGYHTFDQMVTHINSMENLYNDFVSISEIGQSIEGRPIFAVKISDNPDVDESDEEGVVYFDALTHSREPMSLESTLYYMWWLLENMGTDPEVDYLVQNREMYFVPIVNPDGYVFNEAMAPNGGGLWRKNRRNAGNGCFGVDLNRNYSKGWGLNSGSSNDPCTEIYRGENPFSEPEAAAVANFLAQIDPSIAFTIHTYGDKFLSPWGYVDSLASYELYAEFVSEFIPANYDGYGTTAKMLGYTSSGTTRDYLHSEGVLGWTPEIGHSFWESPSVICDRVEEFRKTMKYLSWVSGNYTCFHDFTLHNQPIGTGDIITMDIRLKNRGLTKSATNVSVVLTSTHPSINTIQGQADFGTINQRAYASSENGAFQFEVTGAVNPGERIPFIVDVFQNNTLSYRKTIYVTAGVEEVLYQTDFETDNAWLDQVLDWDTSFMDAVSGFHSFADSRYGNYAGNTNAQVIMSQPVDLSLATLPYASFNAKWSLEPNADVVSFMASTNGVSNWVSLPGLYTNALNEYTNNSHWVQERVDLSAFIGEPEVYFAFLLDADFSVHSDGIYIDDFKVSDYTSPMMTNVNEQDAGLNNLRLTPNPTKDQALLAFNSLNNHSTLLQIYSLSGTKVFQKTLELTSGLNTIPINTQSYPAGLYVIQLISDEEILRLKFVVD